MIKRVCLDILIKYILNYLFIFYLNYQTQENNMQVYPVSPETMEENSSRPIILPTIRSSVEVATISKAEEYRNKQGIRLFDEKTKSYKNYPICSTPESKFGSYGIGLELYFYFIRQMTFLFLLISLISIYPMHSNYTGHEFGSTNQNERYTYLTLANQAGIDQYETDLGAARSQLSDIKSNLNKLWAIDLISVLVFLLFICYFVVTSKAKVQKALGEHYRICDFAVQVEGFPPFITKELVLDHFSEYGEIEEVYMSRNYEGKLPAYKKIYELAYDIEFDQVVNHQRNVGKCSTLNEEIKDNKIGINKTHDELMVDKVFVVFDNLKAKKDCLKDHKNTSVNYNCCFRKRKGTQTRRYARFHLNIQSAPNPSDILWENMEFSYFYTLKRKVAVFFCTLLINLVSFIVIFMLKGYFKNSFTDTDCKLKKISGNISVDHAKELYKRQSEVNCFCKQQSINSIVFDSDYSSFCAEYISSITNDSLLRLGISLFIVFINFLLKIMIQYLSKFERYKSKSIKRKNLLQKMFILSFVNTALTTLLSNMKISSDVEGLNGKYEDLNREWYDDVGSTIQVTMIVNIFSPHAFTLLFLWPFDILKRKLCHKRYKSQLKLNKLFKGPSFDISESLSQVLVVIFTNFFYSSGIPFLNPICFVTLILTYFCNKILILRYYRAPPEFNHEINESLFIYLPFAIIFHCIFSIYSFGASEIFPSSISKPADSKYIIFETVSLSERIKRNAGISSVVLIFVSALLIFYIRFKQTEFFERFWKFKSYSKKNIDKISLKELKVSNKLTGLQSYDIYKNPSYKNLIKALDSVVKKRKELGLDEQDDLENRQDSDPASNLVSSYLRSDLGLHRDSINSNSDSRNQSQTINNHSINSNPQKLISYTI
jgi:hypothetical protein